MSPRAPLWFTLVAAAAGWLHVSAQTRPVIRYDAITDREPRREAALPTLQGAGANFFDPAFSSQLWRITDGRTRPGAVDRSYRTPSGTHQNAWSADGAYFFIVSTDGTVMPYAFDAAAKRARRIDPEDGGDGGFVLRFYIEPHFSYTTPGVVFGTFSGSGATLRTIDAYDFSRKEYERLLNLDTLAPNLNGTYVGGVGSGGTDVERVMTFFAGASQDRHHLAVVFDRRNPNNRQLVDTRASTLNGRATNIPLKFALHHAFIERSGRFVLLYPTAADRQAPRSAAPAYVWDLEAGSFTELPGDKARSNGHDAYGFGVMINQDCCTATSWDAAQWQFRTFAAPRTTRDLIVPVAQPKQVLLSEHPSWHNARPDILTPFIAALFRYGGNDVPWRAWDDEIVAVETGARDRGATVWRFAHHRSDVAADDEPSRPYFWYTPRPNVSPDGRWVLFTSNWEKRLGTDPRGEASGRARQDVFLLELRGVTGGEPEQESALRITSSALPDGLRNSRYGATLEAAGGRPPLTWRVESGSLPPGLRLAPDGVLTGTCRWSGTWTFTAVVSDSSRATDTRSFTLVMRR